MGKLRRTLPVGSVIPVQHDQHLSQGFDRPRPERVQAHRTWQPGDETRRTAGVGAIDVCGEELRHRQHRPPQQLGGQRFASQVLLAEVAPVPGVAPAQDEVLGICEPQEPLRAGDAPPTGAASTMAWETCPLAQATASTGSAGHPGTLAGPCLPRPRGDRSVRCLFPPAGPLTTVASHRWQTAEPDAPRPTPAPLGDGRDGPGPTSSGLPECSPNLATWLSSPKPKVVNLPRAGLLYGSNADLFERRPHAASSASQTAVSGDKGSSSTALDRWPCRTRRVPHGR